MGEREKKVRSAGDELDAQLAQINSSSPCTSYWTRGGQAKKRETGSGKYAALTGSMIFSVMSLCASCKPCRLKDVT